MKKLPLGISDFPEMIEDGYIYVDRTKEMYDLINYSKYVFLSRPRRFGKSLLISVLQSMFEGKKELFKGLWIEDKVDWQEYPVIRIDFGSISYKSLDFFEKQMASILDAYAAQYNVTLKLENYASKTWELIQKVYQTTGKRLVVLIDEYDAPISRHITDSETAKEYQNSLRDFYSILKAQNQYLKFVFMTGISKFAKMSIFSVINLMKDVSLLQRFNNILGFTLQDLEEYFIPYISNFAKKTELTEDELLENLTIWYDGYSWDGQNRLFNPYSIVNTFKDLKFKNYWFETGTSSILMKLIKEKYAIEMKKVPTMEEFESQYAVGLDNSYDLEQRIPLMKLLFETGYLTVKKLEKIMTDELYTLSYPNYEVRTSFNTFIIAAFSNNETNLIQSQGTLMKKALIENDKQSFLTILRSLFAGIPYQLRNKASEAYYHGLFYLVLTLLGVRLNLENATDKGRIDCTLELPDKIYIIEFKYGEKSTMEYLLNQAMTQISSHQYYEPFEGLDKEIWLLGVGFLVKKDKELKKNVLTIEGELKRHS